MVTSVHHPDDARIRSKLIPTLAREWEVSYAASEPGPTDTTDHIWLPLTGTRLQRLWQAARLMSDERWDLVALHDPELLIPGLWRARSGKATLFDLHENLPAQLSTREGIPGPLRPVASGIARWVLRMAEATMAITLAEPGYAELFRAEHPVIANYLPTRIPEPRPPADPPYLAYLGDITVVRGAFLAVEAASGAGQPLVMVGRVSPPTLAAPLQRRADELGVELRLLGPRPHQEALEIVAAATAGLSPLFDIGNYRNSLPTKVPEYLAMGLPVVASDLPGTRQAVEGFDGVTFVTPGDAGAWMEAGRAIVEDPGRRRLAATQAVEVRRQFTWPEEEVLSVYRKAARL